MKKRIPIDLTPQLCLFLDFLRETEYEATGKRPSYSRLLRERIDFSQWMKEKEEEYDGRRWEEYK